MLAISIGVVGVGGGSTNSCLGFFQADGDCSTGSAITEATVGSTADLGDFIGGSPTITGAISVTATALNTMDATSGGGVGGVVAVGAFSPDARGAHKTKASLAADVGSVHPSPALGGTVGDPGATNLTVSARATDLATATMFSAGGGVVAVDSSTAYAQSRPTVEATMGSGQISAANDILLEAVSQTNARANGDSVGGGAVRVGVMDIDAAVYPTVTATVTGGFISAGGTLTITATHGGTPPQFSDGTITSLNTTTETLSFGGLTGLSTGDTVVYSPPSDSLGNPVNPVIGGLVGGATYGIIFVNGMTIKLGQQFEFACSGGNKACVDPATGTLTFSAPHNFRTGDMVNYSVLSGGSAIQAVYGGTPTWLTGALPADLYQVVVIDDYSIRLRKPSTPTTTISLVPGATFDISGGHGLNQNAAVTYSMGTEISFNGNWVDVTPVWNGSNWEPALTTTTPFPIDYSNDTNLILAPGNAFQHGDRVVFCPSGSGCGSALGLTAGKTYVVSVVTQGVSFRLREVCVVDSTTCSPPSPPDPVDLSPAAGTYVLRPVDSPITGLTLGNTYWVNVVDFDSFQLMSAPCTLACGGLVINVNGAGRVNTHTLTATPSPTLNFVPGVALDPSDDPITGGNTFNTLGGHGLAQNAPVTYHVPGEDSVSGDVSFNGTDVDATAVFNTSEGVYEVFRVSGNVDHSIDNNQIIAIGHGFHNGDKVIYCPTGSGCTGAAIGPLANTVYVVDNVVAGISFELRAVCRYIGTCPSGPADPVVLTPGSGVKVLRPVDPPITGLTPGNTYYVNVVDFNSFQLMTSPCSSGCSSFVSVGGTGLVNTHTFSIDGIAMVADGTGTNELVVNLTSVGGCCPAAGNDPPTNHTMIGVGGSRAYLTVAGVPRAGASSAGGGLVSVANVDAKVTNHVNVTTDVQGGTLVGRDVVISAASAANGVADATNSGGGLVSVGDTNARADISNTVMTKVNGSVRAYRDLQILATGLDLASTEAKTNGGGLVATANADANTDIAGSQSITLGRQRHRGSHGADRGPPRHQRDQLRQCQHRRTRRRVERRRQPERLREHDRDDHGQRQRRPRLHLRLRRRPAHDQRRRRRDQRRSRLQRRPGRRRLDHRPRLLQGDRARRRGDAQTRTSRLPGTRR